MRIIHLITDFGASEYPGVMEAVMRREGYHQPVVHLTHSLAPQEVRQAAFILSGAIPFMAPASLIVAVVDPGVGSQRRILLAEWEEHWLLLPDNGLITPFHAHLSQVWNIPFQEIFRPVSSTFHGRDVFAICAARLALGQYHQLSFQPLEIRDVHLLDDYFPQIQSDRIDGQIIHIDPFGNCITNIPRELLWLVKTLRCGGFSTTQLHDHYAQTDPGTAMALVSSYNTLEFAVNQGHFARQFGVQLGETVEIILTTEGK